MSTTEATVEKGKGATAFDEARASVKAAEAAPETAQEDAPSAEEQPARQTEEPATGPKETGEDQDAILTSEELSKLTPAQRENATKWTAKLTQRNMAIKAKEDQLKEVEEWLPLIESLKSNPDAAIEILAQQRGYKLSKTAEEAVAAQTTETLAKLPEGLEFLKPIFDDYGKQLLNAVRSEIAPIKQANDQRTQAAAAAETEGTLKAFSAKHPGWEAYEKDMIAIGQKVVPSADMDSMEYLELLYKVASSGKTDAEATKRAIEKINKSVEASETKKPGIPSERVAHAMPPPEKRTIRDAFEAAKRGEVWEK